jgi:hypothetical protein
MENYGYMKSVVGKTAVGEWSYFAVTNTHTHTPLSKVVYKLRQLKLSNVCIVSVS